MKPGDPPETRLDRCHDSVVPRLSEPFALREFRGLWLARGLSLMGDQLARVALAVLVFHRTGSPAWTAFVYALTYLPYLAGPIFAGIADRRSRRSVMIALDLVRGVLVVAMALPGVPLAVMGVLLAVATALSPVYDAARSATLPDVMSKSLYPTGLAVFTITTEAAQVIGFAVGGLLVSLTGARLALALDGLTYIASALLVMVAVVNRAAPMAPRAQRMRESLRIASRFVFGSQFLRALLALAWLNALWMVPEGLAAPYAAQVHAGAVGVGVLLAAIPFGCVIGAALVSRFAEHERRLRLMRPLAALAAAPLVVCFAHPGLVVSVLLWMLCGVGTAYNVPANSGFVQALPTERRAQAIALVTTGMVLGQGLAVLAGGALADVWNPASVVAATGVVALAVVGVLWRTWLRAPAVIDLSAEVQVAEPAVS